jgi:hydroxymethylbilane synthase
MSNSQQPILTTLNIATRQSPLALWQAEHIRDRLLALYPDLTINLLKVTRFWIHLWPKSVVKDCL